MWFDANGGYDRTKIEIAHKWCQDMTEKAMQSGDDVVVSNTFIKLWEMTNYGFLALKYKYTLKVTTATGGWPNTHNVPGYVVKRMAKKFEPYQIK